MVSLAQGQQRRDPAVAGRVGVAVVSRAGEVGQRVDEEGGVVHEDEAGDPGDEVPALPVAPQQAAHHSGHEDAHDGSERQVVAVLETDDGVLIQVLDGHAADLVRVLLHQHPPHVRVPEALHRRVRVALSVHVAVVSAMVAGPPAHGALHSGGAGQHQADGQALRGFVGAVCKQAVVACRQARKSEQQSGGSMRRADGLHKQPRETASRHNSHQHVTLASCSTHQQ